MSEEARQQAISDVNLGIAYTQEGNPTGALVVWERAVRRDPTNAEARLCLGQAYAALDRHAEAERHLREAVRLYEARVGQDETLRASLAEARNSLGVLLINADRAAEAVPMLQQVTAELTYTTPFLAWGNLGQALMRSGRVSESVTALERAVAIQPNFCVGWSRLGEARLRAHDLAHALEALDRAAAVQAPGCDRIQEVYLNRAKVKIELHQPDRAREDLARCIELAADTPVGRECAALSRSVAP
ncbi:MAG: tetratricopeptide repeat protein [Myxococcales bacterium]|nr:tetratricopeptide repeat protein [Myxococcales bacterium]